MKTAINIYLIGSCITLLFIQCSSSKIIGNYNSNNSDSYLSLKEDETFEAGIKGHMIYRKTKGIWKKSDNLISLKSFDSFRYFNVIEKDSANLKNLTFIMESPNGYEALGCYILLNKDSTKRYYFPDNGVLTIPKESNNFTSITIYSPSRYEFYNKKKMKSNFFNISFDYNNNSKWYIDEKYIIKGEKLFSTEYKDFFFRKL